MNILEVLKSDQQIYTIVFANETYTFRGLNLKESKYFLELINQKRLPSYYLYEQIFNLIYVGDIIFLSDKLPIGHAITIGELALSLALDENNDDILFEIASARKKYSLDTLEMHMISVIMVAFPSYKYSELQIIDKKEFVKLFVIAENILTKTKPDYIRLDLKKIYDNLHKEEIKEEKQVVQEVKQEQRQYAEPEGMQHFQNDTEQLRGAVGYWEVQEAEEKVRKEEEEALKLRILKELDARNKRG
jgi:hypothetical protein